MKDIKNHDYSLLVIRLIAGLVLLYFGSQKMLGVMGGKGFAGTIAMFEQGMGIPPALAACAIFSEFFGALGLIFGFVTRFAAFGVASTMLVAVAQHSKGFNLENPALYKDLTYPLLIAGMAIPLLISGSGKIALDAYFSKKKAT